MFNGAVELRGPGPRLAFVQERRDHRDAFHAEARFGDGANQSQETRGG